MNQKILEALNAAGSPRPPVPVPFNGQTFYVRKLTGAQRSLLQRYQFAELRKRADIAEKMETKPEPFDLLDSDWAAISLCDEKGTAVFDNVQQGVEFLHQLDGDLQLALAMQALKENGLTEDAAAKKSETSQTSSSGIGSSAEERPAL